jgi:hypothetical protein
MTAVRIIDSVMAVGLAASSLPIYPLCVLPFAQVRPLMLLSFFSVRNIKLSKALFLSSVVTS